MENEPAPVKKRSHKKKPVPEPKRNLLAERLADGTNNMLAIVTNPDSTEYERAKSAVPVLSAAAEILLSLSAGGNHEVQLDQLMTNLPEELQIPDGLLDRLCPLARACALLGMFSTMEALGLPKPDPVALRG
jgi:hypothetical protein